MSVVELLNKQKWRALGEFLLIDLVQILIVSVLVLDQETPQVVGLDFTRSDPLVSSSLFLGICTIQVFLVYAVALSVRRSKDLVRLYPHFDPSQKCDCKFGRDQIVQWVLDLAKEERVRVHDIFLMRSPFPNAFTFSLPLIGSTVVVHSNVLDLLQPSEVRAIIAHELGHIKNKDSVIMILLRIPSFFVQVVYVYIYARLILALVDTLLVNFDPTVAVIRLGVLVGFALLSRLALFLSMVFLQKASRRAELISDVDAATVVGVEVTINALIRLGQRIEAINALVNELRWLQFLGADVSGQAAQNELNRMILLYPLDSIEEGDARRLAPEVFLSSRLKHLRDVYGVALSDNQIEEAILPALKYLGEKRGPAPATPTGPSAGKVDWRQVDHDGNRRLSSDEIQELIRVLRENPTRLMFDSEVGARLLVLDHPDFRRRILTIADAFGL